jgi:hypothetical protein
MFERPKAVLTLDRAAIETGKFAILGIYYLENSGGLNVALFIHVIASRSGVINRDLVLLFL